MRLPLILLLPLMGVLPAIGSATCTPSYSEYLANKAQIRELLAKSNANINAPAYRNLSAENFDYRFCTAAWTFHVMRLADSKEYNVLERYLASRSDEADPVFRSVSAWAHYVQNPESGLKSVKEFLAAFESARGVLFEMNEILLKEFGETKTLPKTLRVHGSFSAVYTDILTRHYATDADIARVFDQMLSRADLAAEYRHEYASYVKRNIPTYRRYSNLKSFVSATLK